MGEQDRKIIILDYSLDLTDMISDDAIKSRNARMDEIVRHIKDIKNDTSYAIIMSGDSFND